jgi:hypothetical protein
MLINKTKRTFAITAALQLILFLSMITAQVTVCFSADVTPADKRAYLAALKDAEVTEQNEISRRLLAVVEGQDRVNLGILSGDSIVWEGEPGASRVLVATFMSRSSYDSYYKENLEQHQAEYILKKSLWVTVIPEVKNFFIRKNAFSQCPPSAKRVEQLLGLNPGYDYEVLLEMWVDQKALFRSSPDPEITDHEAEIATRIADNNWTFPCDINPFLKLDDTVLVKESQWSTTAVPYRTWFINRAQTIYAVGNEDDPTTWGYPWTRLGYTYDWGNPVNHVGVSEFVLRIDPNVNGGEVTVTLERAIDSATPEWNYYFQCETEN